MLRLRQACQASNSHGVMARNVQPPGSTVFISKQQISSSNLSNLKCNAIYWIQSNPTSSGVWAHLRMFFLARARMRKHPPFLSLTCPRARGVSFWGVFLGMVLTHCRPEDHSLAHAQQNITTWAPVSGSQGAQTSLPWDPRQ